MNKNFIIQSNLHELIPINLRVQRLDYGFFNEITMT